jgi:hypothetical protein
MASQTCTRSRGTLSYFAQSSPRVRSLYATFLHPASLFCGRRWWGVPCECDRVPCCPNALPSHPASTTPGVRASPQVLTVRQSHWYPARGRLPSHIPRMSIMHQWVREVDMFSNHRLRPEGLCQGQYTILVHLHATMA